MQKWVRLWLSLLALALCAPTAHTQPVDLPIPAATTDQYPPGIKVIRSKSGPVYANAKGQTLYGLDMRTLLRAGPDPSKYCKDDCAQLWEPILAAEGAKANIQFPRGFGGRPTPPPAGFVSALSAPDWSIIESSAGLQYVYKGWHLVFVRKGDRPGATSFDGADAKIWNTLKFVPPVPEVNAPAGVKPTFIGGSYVLADKDGMLLFTGTCAKACDWTPLSAGMASAGLGDWRVIASGDQPQWSLRGKPVYVSSDADRAPKGGKVLKP